MLLLSKDGIFPITKDSEGKLLAKEPATGLSIPGTIQGEGKLAGTPSLFIRLAKCNLCCIWELPDKNICRCDTNFTVNSLRNSKIKISDAVNIIKHNLGLLNHIVITGGEPFIQKKSLTQLIIALKSETNAHITLETNGTLFDINIARNIDLMSISPKLKNSNPTQQKTQLTENKSYTLELHNKNRLNIEALQSFIDIANNHCKDIQFKFVISSSNDEYEIKDEILSRLNNLSNSDIFVMPLGSTVKELEQTSPIAFEMAVKNGWRFSPRLHINLFNNKSKV